MSDNWSLCGIKSEVMAPNAYRFQGVLRDHTKHTKGMCCHLLLVGEPKPFTVTT